MDLNIVLCRLASLRNLSPQRLRQEKREEGSRGDSPEEQVYRRQKNKDLEISKIQDNTRDINFLAGISRLSPLFLYRRAASPLSLVNFCPFFFFLLPASIERATATEELSAEAAYV